jgi:hypothetical protein
VDKIALALKVKRLVQWLDGQAPSASLVRRQFQGAPFGNCYVTIDPERQAPFASVNTNRVYLCGTEAGMDSGSVGRLIDLFAGEGIERFFVWLSPGPDMDKVRGWLEGHGLNRIRHIGYPTLYRAAGSPVQFKTDLEVRQVSRAEIATARDQLGETLWPEYANTADMAGFFHYMAFDGRRPVAVAALAVFEDLGYLMAARTAESDRKRGAQQALIAKRVERAGQIGCAILVSETLTMLEHSHRNLHRAGFAEAFEKEVYQWNG